MTYKEAIKILEEVKANNNGMSQYLKGFDEAFEIAIKAIEKQVLKKPIQSNEPRYGMGNEYYDWICPNCGEWLAWQCDSERFNIHHCRCGQAIKWD